MIRLLVALGALTLAACEQPAPPAPAPEPERAAETVVFEFIHPGHNERFRAQTSDPAVIALARAELAKPMEERGLHPHGQITRGDGTNPPYSWSYGQWNLVEVSILECDGWPSGVEANLDHYLRVGYFCPWTAKVEREVTE